MDAESWARLKQSPRSPYPYRYRRREVLSYVLFPPTASIGLITADVDFCMKTPEYLL